MSNKSSFDFYSLWEELFNDNFNSVESHRIKNDASTQSFTMSPSRWIYELDSFLKMTRKDILNGSGKISHE